MTFTEDDFAESKPKFSEADFVEDSGQSRPASAANAVMQGGGKGMGQTVSGLARFATLIPPTSMLPGDFPPMPINEASQAAAEDEQRRMQAWITKPAAQREAELRANPIYKAGQEITQGAEEAYPTNPKFRGEFFSDVLPSSAGAMVPTIASAVVGGPIVGALQYGASQGQQEAESAIAAGKEDQADNVFLLNLGIGAASEALLGAPANIMRYVRAARKAGVDKKIVKETILKEIGKGALREGGQEGIEQVGQNVIAQQTYDPNRPITEGLPESVAAGLLLGGAASGGAVAVGRATRVESEADKAAKNQEEADRARIRARMAGYAITPDDFKPQPIQPTRLDFGEVADEAQSRQENESLVEAIMKGRNENPSGNVEQNKVEAPSPLSAFQGKPAEAGSTPEVVVGTPQPSGAGDVATKLFANMQGRTMNVQSSDLSKPSSHLQQLFGKDAPTYQQLIDAGHLELVNPEAPIASGEVGLKAKMPQSDATGIAERIGMTFSGESPGQVPGQPSLWDFKFKNPSVEMFSVVVPVGTPEADIIKARDAKVAQLKASGEWKESSPVKSNEPTPATPVNPQKHPGVAVVVSTGKPNGAKAEIQYDVVEAASLKPSIVRDVSADQTRQRTGNAASDEQIAKIATAPDISLLAESPTSTIGAPIVDDVVIAGNGRASGIIAGYEGSTKGSHDYRRGVVEAAKRLGLGDVSGMVNPVLIRRVKRYTSGDKAAFVVESNPRYAALKESASEASMLDAQALGDIGALSFNESGSLTTAGVQQVARLFDASQRNLTRTVGGDFDVNEANKRVQLAALATIAKENNVEIKDLIGLIESDDGKRVMGEVTKASPRFTKLDADLRLGGYLLSGMRELQSGISSVRDGHFKSLDEWYAERQNQLLKSELNPIAEEILKLMVASQKKPTVLRDFFDNYLQKAEYEQNQRNEAGATADIFGEKRQPVSTETIAASVLQPGQNGGQPSTPVAKGNKPEVRADVKSPELMTPAEAEASGVTREVLIAAQEKAVAEKRPLNAESADRMASGLGAKLNLPEGYVKKGAEYVFEESKGGESPNGKKEIKGQAGVLAPGSKVHLRGPGGKWINGTAQDGEYIFGVIPMPWTVIAETTDPKFPDDPRTFDIRNDRTKEVLKGATLNQLVMAKIQNAEERAAAKGKSKKDLQDELVQLYPASQRASIRDSIRGVSAAELREMIKREKAKKKGGEPAANLGEGLPEGAGWDAAGIHEAVRGEDAAGFGYKVISRDEAVQITGEPRAFGYSGFFYKGKIYLVAENLRRGNSEYARATLREEVGHGLLRTPEGQILLRKVLAEGKLNLNDAIEAAKSDAKYETLSDDAKVMRDLLNQGYRDENNQLLDEFIAKSARENRTWWQNVVDAVRAFLSKLGLKLSNEETARLLLKQIRASQPDANGNIPGERFVASNAVITAPGVTEAPAITAHHGTPHKVDKFTTAKIGTGEGAQAYGWGLYYAGSEKVAEQYRDSLGRIEITIDGELFVRDSSGVLRDSQGRTAGRLSPLQHLAAYGLSSGVDNASNPINIIAEQAESFLQTRQDVSSKEAAAAASLIRDGKVSLRKVGNKYTVELNVEPDELLDWDKPAQQQSEKIQEFIQGTLARGNVDFWNKNWTGQQIYNVLANTLSKERQFGSGDTAWSGKVQNDKLATEHLASLGIKGIRYLDQGSRGGEWVVEIFGGDKEYVSDKIEAEARQEELEAEGYDVQIFKRKPTYNYVIFSDDDITITHENGQPVSVQDAIGSGVRDLQMSAVPASRAGGMSAAEIASVNRELNALNEKQGKTAADNARIVELERQLGQQDLFDVESKPVEDAAKKKQREEIARRQNRRLVAGQIEDQGGLFAEKKPAAQVDMFSAPNPKTEMPPAFTARSPEAGLFGDLAPSGTENPEEIRSQFRGNEYVGRLRMVENISETRAAIKERVFNSTPAVSTERTDSAWQIAHELTDEVTKAGHALRHKATIGGQDLALPLLKDEVVRYAMKLAANGNDALLRFSLDSKWQTITGGDESTAGSTLRAARELSESPALRWLQTSMTTEREAAARAGARMLPQETFLALARDMENLRLNPDELEAFLNRARTPDGRTLDDLLAEATSPAPETPRAPRAPREAGTPDTMLPGFELTDAERVAQEILARLENRHSGVEWLRPDTNINEVRRIIREALRSNEPILENPTPIVENIQALLETAGVEAETARALGREVETERQTRWANRRAGQMNRAAGSKSLRSLIESILTTPYRAQHDPAWRRETAIRWFESNGLSREQAEAAAGLFDAQFNAALSAAAEKVAQNVLKEGRPRTDMQLERLIRSGVLDPSKPWADTFAAQTGWKKPTPEQFKKLVELEEKISDPALSPSEVAATIEQQMAILRHVGKRDGAGQRAFAESFTASLLSNAIVGGRTFTVQLAPMMTTIRDFAAASVQDPKNILNFAKAIRNTYRTNLLNQAKYGWQKNAFQFHINEIEQSYNELQRVSEETDTLLKNPKTSMARKGVAKLQQVYALQRYVFRLLNTLDNAQMSAGKEWKLVYYASRAFKEAGINSPSKVSDLIDWMTSVRQSAYEKAKDAGLDDLTASVRADNEASEAAYDFIANNTNSNLADQAWKAAENDVYSVVGRRASDIGEFDEGFISKPMNWLMASTSEARRRGGLASVGVTLAVGMVNIPFRSARFASEFYGYGLVRYGLHRYRTTPGRQWIPGMKRDGDTFWKQSFATELQAKHRRNLAITSLAVTAIALANALKNSTADDDAGKEKVGVYITGAGPKNKGLRDAWIKEGWRPYSIHFVLNGIGIRKLTVPLTRVGEGIFPPLLAAGVADTVKWRQKEAATTGNEISVPSVATMEAIGAHFQLLQNRGIFQTISQYQKLAEGGSGFEKNIARLVGSSIAASVMPFKSAISTISDMILGPMDDSSATAVLANQFPIVGLGFQHKAVNRFGDELYDRSWYGKVERLGYPISFQVAPTPENKKIYPLLIEKGVAAPELRRYVLEEKYGQLTDEQFADFATKSGALLKQSTNKNISAIAKMTPEAAKDFLSSAAQQADKIAASALALTPKPKAAPATAASESPAATPAPASPSRASAPAASPRPVSGGSTSRAPSGRIRSSLASFKVPRLKKAAGRIRSRLSRGFKAVRSKVGRIRSRIGAPRRSRIRYAI